MRKTQKKERFAHKYVSCGNASEAYRFAYSAEKMKPESVRRMASKLLKDIYVASTIRQLQEGLMNKLDISAERVLAEYSRVAFCDLRDLFDEHNNFRSIHAMNPDTVAVIADIDVSADPGAGVRMMRVRVCDKLKALDALARHLGLFRADQEQGRKLVVVKDFTGEKFFPESPAEKQDGKGHVLCEE